MKRKINILCVGSLPPPIGGISIVNQLLFNTFLSNNSISTVILNPNERVYNNYRGKIRLLRDIFRKLKDCDLIFLSLSTHSVKSVGLFFLILSLVTRRKLVMRKGGGTDFRSFNKLSAFISGFVLRNAYLYLAETKYLEKAAKDMGFRNVMWCPNLRSRPQLNIEILERKIEENNHSELKLIFLGQVKESKGIGLIKSISPRLPSNVTIDIFGPCLWEHSEDSFNEFSNIFYRGILDFNLQKNVLTNYHALVLPTFHDGEGYPGVIIEAMMFGLAVITTRWLAIPEMVDQSCSILVEPRSEIDLLKAIYNISESAETLNTLRINALSKSQVYDVDKWTRMLITNHFD